MDGIIGQIYTVAKNKLPFLTQVGPIDITHITQIVQQAMTAADSVSATMRTYLTGATKQDFVIQVIKFILQELVTSGRLSSDLQTRVNAAIDTLGPVMFPLIVSASKGQLDLVHLEAAAASCCAASKGCSCL